MPDELIYAWLNSKSGFSIMPYVMHVFEVWAYSSLDHVLKYMYIWIVIYYLADIWKTFRYMHHLRSISQDDISLISIFIQIVQMDFRILIFIFKMK